MLGTIVCHQSKRKFNSCSFCESALLLQDSFRKKCHSRFRKECLCSCSSHMVRVEFNNTLSCQAPSSQVKSRSCPAQVPSSPGPIKASSSSGPVKVPSNSGPIKVPPSPGPINVQSRSRQVQVKAVSCRKWAGTVQRAGLDQCEPNVYLHQ